MRLVCGGSRGAAEEAFGGEVFVEVGPMDAVAGAGDLPVGSLGGRGVEESGVPGQGDGDAAAVGEVDDEGGLGKTDVFDAFVSV